MENKAVDFLPGPLPCALCRSVPELRVSWALGACVAGTASPTGPGNPAARSPCLLSQCPCAHTPEHPHYLKQPDSTTCASREASPCLRLGPSPRDVMLLLSLGLFCPNPSFKASLGHLLLKGDLRPVLGERMHSGRLATLFTSTKATHAKPDHS